MIVWLLVSAIVLVAVGGALRVLLWVGERDYGMAVTHGLFAVAAIEALAALALALPSGG